MPWSHKLRASFSCLQENDSGHSKFWPKISSFGAFFVMRGNKYEISMSVGIISRLRHFVPLNTLHHINISLIHPYLLYGIAALGCAGKTYRDKILRLQKRALRLMYFRSLFQISLSVYLKAVVILMHDVFNNSSPPQMNNIFNFQWKIHSYYTRSSSRGNFFVQYSRLDKKNKSFS